MFFISFYPNEKIGFLGFFLRDSISKLSQLIISFFQFDLNLFVQLWE